MGFTFGTQKSKVVENGNYLRNFKKGETKTRFLQESPEWHAYWEHYMDGKSFPCMEITECPGCSSDNEQVKRRSRKYGTFIYLVDQKRVLPFKIGSKLSERLTVRAERNGNTLLNRDYVIIRSGSGLDTDYDVDQDERYEFDTTSAWKQRGDMEIETILAENFTAVFGDPDTYLKNYTEQSTSVDYRSGSSTKPSGGDKSLGFADEKDRSSETPSVPGTKEAEDKPPFDEGEQEVTVEQLKGMKRSELKKVWMASDLGQFDDDWDTDEIVTKILELAS